MHIYDLSTQFNKNVMTWCSQIYAYFFAILLVVFLQETLKRKHIRKSRCQPMGRKLKKAFFCSVPEIPLQKYTDVCLGKVGDYTLHCCLRSFCSCDYTWIYLTVVRSQDDCLRKLKS